MKENNGDLIYCMMKEYIENKDSRKQIKEDRYRFMQTHKCDGVDCIRDGTDLDDYCDSCKTRHGFFLKLKKLSVRNSVILRAVRRLVK